MTDVLLSVAEEPLNIAQHAADTLVDFGVDGIIDNLIGLCLEHLINHLPTGEMLSYHVYALVDKIIGGGVNRSVHGEIASLLKEIRVLVHIRVLLLLGSV
jgi:hypothetical protein